VLVDWLAVGPVMPVWTGMILFGGLLVSAKCLPVYAPSAQTIR
jgi:hypothetical protein